MKRSGLPAVLILLVCAAVCMQVLAAGVFRDGRYTGQAQGRNGIITADVTVKDGKVVNIDVDGPQETPTFFGRAMQIIPQMIGASTDAELAAVDTVSGATMSSHGIKNAVREAMKHARDSLPWEHAAEEHCPGNDFSDMPPYGSWAHAAIDWAVSTGLTTGITPQQFAPEKTCTRAEMVTFLWRAAKSPLPRNAVPGFSDVPPESYYARAVCWAVEQGIVMGTSASTFSPDAVCTRAQAVTFLYRAAGAPKVLTGSDFTDLAVGAYYFDAVVWATGQQITTGVSEDRFAPEAPCTRAQIVTLLFRDQEG